MKLRYDVTLPVKAIGSSYRYNPIDDMLGRFMKSGKDIAEVQLEGSFKNAASAYGSFRERIKKLDLNDEIVAAVRSKRLFLLKKKEAENDEG